MSLFARLSQVFQPEKETPKKPIRKKPSIKTRKPSPKKTPRSRFDSRPITTTKTTQDSDSSLREAQARAREILIEAKDEALRIREQTELKARKLQDQFNTSRSSLDKKTHELDRKQAVLQEKERFLNKLENEKNIKP